MNWIKIDNIDNPNGRMPRNKTAVRLAREFRLTKYEAKRILDELTRKKKIRRKSRKSFFL